MKRTPPHPINPYIVNPFAADLYLNLKRKNSFRMLRRMLELLLSTEISCSIPQKLYIPHPFGILCGGASKIAEDCTLMQFCLLGPKDPWYQGPSLEGLYPTLEEGAYISAGAKVLGPVRIGAWSVVGANAVVTEDVPPFSTVFGQNRILRSTEGGPPQIRQYLESRKRGVVP